MSLQGSVHPAKGSPVPKGLTQSGAIPLPAAGEKETGSASLKLSLWVQHTTLPSIQLLLLPKSVTPTQDPKIPRQLFGPTTLLLRIEILPGIAYTMD